MFHYSDYVDPNIGSIGHLLSATRPLVHLPHSMAQIHPIFDESIRDLYVAPEIFSFPMFAATVMADVEGNKTFRSMRDHDFEEVRCYKGSVLLMDSDVNVEYTVTERCALYRFTFPKGSGKALLRFATRGEGKVSFENAALSGTSEQREVPYAVYATLSCAPDAVEEKNGKIICSFPEGTVLLIKAGFSHIDVEQAHVNLEKEAAGLSFDEAAKRAQDIWDATLGKIEVKGGTDKQRRIFYTSLYRVHQRMINIGEYGRYYSGYDKQVHNDDRAFYVNDGVWDTYRSAHPLQLILDPERQSDIVDSYVRMYRQGGILPTFPHEGGNVPCMIGKHSAAMITDSYLKGLRGFDIETAWEGIVKNEEEMTKLPWRIGPVNEFDECYFKNGFFPALPDDQEEWLPAHPFERRQCVAVTLETAYDEYCISALARALGKPGSEKYAERSKNYRKVFNPETGFMTPKTADGKWVPDFDPKLSGGQGGRAYFAECNSWTYTLHVQHDIEGLSQLMGGRKGLENYLDKMLSEQYGTSKYVFLGLFPDSTGLIGQFCMGNEPSFHIPYLYNYTDSPWKAQKLLRDIMSVWFDDTPIGICGDEDGGAMCAWYVFSAMGFYPTCPGKTGYDLGSPLFDEVKIHLSSGKTFTIVAQGNSSRAKYIQKAELSGKRLSGMTIDHQAIINGETLVLTMGEKPAKNA